MPERWLEYCPVGGIVADRFLPFKTPLSREFFNNNIQPDAVFTIETLMDKNHHANRRLGLVIDLTFTTRYYDATQWRDLRIDYVKIPCQGHEVNDQPENIERFKSAVRRFLDEHENDGSLIGVHCTHGLNRTGFLICLWLVQEMGWSAQDAVKAFQEARGHNIERPHYIDALIQAEAERLDNSEDEDEEEDEGSGDDDEEEDEEENDSP